MLMKCSLIFACARTDGTVELRARKTLQPIEANYGTNLDTVRNLMDGGYEYSIDPTSEFDSLYGVQTFTFSH